MVGQRIKSYLIENGIKQTFLSEKTGISNSILSLMLSGARKIDVMEYFQICKALKVDMQTFVSDED